VKKGGSTSVQGNPLSNYIFNNLLQCPVSTLAGLNRVTIGEQYIYFFTGLHYIINPLVQRATFLDQFLQNLQDGFIRTKL
jgi:hypothetical protein